jgi:hypothetical protein
VDQAAVKVISDALDMSFHTGHKISSTFFGFLQLRYEFQTKIFRGLRMTMRFRIYTLVTGLFFSIFMLDLSAETPAPPPAAIDLKLFEKSEVDRSKGCTVVLWQANRDPEKDKFAYIFTESFSLKNHARQPAKIKIGDAIVPLTRVALGGKTTGSNLYEYQLYKMPATDEFVVLQLKLAPEEGEAIDVDDGTLSILMKGKPVFRATVKGNAGCYTPAAPDTKAPAAKKTEAPLKTNNDTAEKIVAGNERPAMFERYPVRAQSLPRNMTQEAVKKFGCEAATLRGAVTGYQMSEESAIWQIPCGDYGDKKSAVFALVYLTDPAAQYTFIPFKFPKGENRGLGDYAMMAPTWDMKTRIVSSINTEGNGKDCGTVERHTVTPEGGFKLVELRSRMMCDGKSIGVENFPVVFKAK